MNPHPPVTRIFRKAAPPRMHGKHRIISVALPNGKAKERVDRLNAAMLGSPPTVAWNSIEDRDVLHHRVERLS
jgi:hypothetical protein